MEDFHEEYELLGQVYLVNKCFLACAPSTDIATNAQLLQLAVKNMELCKAADEQEALVCYEQIYCYLLLMGEIGG